MYNFIYLNKISKEYDFILILLILLISLNKLIVVLQEKMDHAFKKNNVT